MNIDSRSPTAVATPAKLARPRLAKVFQRARLHTWLDDITQRAQVLWIEGPPGTGKTTLVGSWLDTRKRPCLWYQIDAGDTDLATFFHYLGIAAELAGPRRALPMPHLTPEYLSDVATFARRYFEQLSARLPAGSVIVFDNMQEMGACNRLYEILEAGLTHLADTVHVFCVSRTALPEPLTRLHINGQLACMKAQALQLSPAEAIGVAAMHGATEFGNIARIHAKTRGWAAGLVLMLEQHPVLADVPVETPEGDAATPQVLFAYFAYEILRHLEAPVRTCLMQSALLPKMYIADVEALTRYLDCGRILAELQKKNYFIYRLSSREIVYEYHPLFREFLLAHLHETCTPIALTGWYRQAAELLETRGDIEAAVALRERAGDWLGIAATIAAHAATLLRQGRWQMLLQWIGALPRNVVVSLPWLLYWDGMGRLVTSPVAARASLEQAYAQFKHRGDAVGVYSTWIAIIDSFIFEWSNFMPMSAWVEEFWQLRNAHPDFPSQHIEHQAMIAIFTGLMYAKPGSPELPLWAGRVEQMIATLEDPELCIKAMPHLSMYYSLWAVDQMKIGMLLHSFNSLLSRPGVSPLARITWHALTVTHYLTLAEYKRCLANINEGLELADAYGIHLWDTVLCCGGALAAMHGRLASAAPYLQRMNMALNPQRRVDRVWYYLPLAQWHIAQAEFKTARAVLTQCLEVVENTGFFFGEAIALIGLARLSVGTAEHDATERLLRRAGIAARLGNSEHAAYCVLIMEAYYALTRDDETRSLRALREFLSVGERCGKMSHPLWDTEIMARLYAKALEHDIYPGYVLSVIRKHRLAPPLDAVSARWPFPFKFHTLGGFSVWKDGAPLASEGKTQRRTLEFLKALIAAGGREVNGADLMHVLRPDAEGDAAAVAVRVNLHRVRKLLGDDDALIFKDGLLSLNPRCVWLDVWAFDICVNDIFLLTEHDAAALGNRLAVLSTRLLALYRGPLLQEEGSVAWLLPARSRCHDALLRAVAQAGQWYEMRGLWTSAVSVYERGIEAEPLAEGIYRALMRCYAAQGGIPDAMRIYRRCREMFSILLGVKPSAATEELVRELRRAA